MGTFVYQHKALPNFNQQISNLTFYLGLKYFFFRISSKTWCFAVPRIQRFRFWAVPIQHWPWNPGILVWELKFMKLFFSNSIIQLFSLVTKMTGGHLIEFHLIESLDRNFLIKQAFDRNQLIESFNKSH